MTVDDEVTSMRRLPLLEERGSTVESSRPHDNGMRIWEMPLGASSMGTRHRHPGKDFLC